MRALKYFLVVIAIFTIYSFQRSDEMNLLNRNYFILTGGPGGGKSTLIKVLRERGYLCMDEVARDIIKKEVTTNGDALPWANKAEFTQKMFGETLKLYESVSSSDAIFFDRGVVDVLAYAKMVKVEISEEMLCTARKLAFNKKVFVTPPWEDIYRNDEERKQSFEEAIETFEHIVKEYQAYGYEIVVLPKTDVEDRINFMLDLLNLPRFQK
ncbi:MAG: putative ATPase [Chlamydiales bacterium]|jgi:predicted ATPase